MDAKITAILVAALMTIAGIAIVAESASATEADTSTMNVYFYDGSSWNSGSYEVFNAYEAVQAGVSTSSTGGLGYIISTTGANTSWTSSDAYNGTYANVSYGQIDGVGKYSSSGSTTTTGFKIFGSNSGGSWDDITDRPLGWIRPFTDYANYAIWADGFAATASVAYANIAIYLDDDNTDGSLVPPSVGLRGLTDPSTRSDCLYEFTIYDATGTVSFSENTYYGKQYNSSGVLESVALDGTELANGITIYGYGSDAYLALLDATTDTNSVGLDGQQETWIENTVTVGDEVRTYYTEYSWMTTLFGYGTNTISEVVGDQTIYHYHYWSCYNSNYDYLNFTFGYYTNVPGNYNDPLDNNASMTGNSFVLIYTNS